MSKCWLFCVLMMVTPWTAQATQVQVVRESSPSVWLVQDTHVPVVHIALTFKDAGYASDPVALQGRATALAEMMMEGTQSKSALEFHEALENHAIEMDVSAGQDVFMLSMKSLSEHADVAVKLLSEALNAPAYDAARFEDVKKQMLSAYKRRQESPNYRAARAWSKLAYGEHPYSRSSLGNETTMAQLAMDDLKRMHDAYLSRENLQISVVGDVDADQVETWVKLLSASLSDDFEPDFVVEDVEIPKQGKYREVTMDVPQTVVRFGTQGVSRHDEAFYPAYVANYVLGGGGLTSRLSEAVRKEKGLTYSISMGLEQNLHSNSWGGGFASRSDQVGEAIKTVEAVLSEAAKMGVSQEELQDTLGYITGSFPLQIDSSASILRYLTSMQLYELGPDYLEKRNQFFEAVTLEQVNQVIKEWMDPTRFLLVKVGQAVETTSP